MTDRDVGRAAEINAASVDDVGPISNDEMSQLVRESAVALVAEGPDGAIAGFCIVVDPGQPPRTEMARWALEHGDLHLERIAFDMRYSGFGLGPQLYDALEERVTALGVDRGVESVNLTSIVRTSNDHAVRFHAARGFETIDRVERDDQTFALVRKSYVCGRR